MRASNKYNTAIMVIVVVQILMAITQGIIAFPAFAQKAPAGPVARPPAAAQNTEPREPPMVSRTLAGSGRP